MEFESTCNGCKKSWYAEGCECTDKCPDLKNEKMLFSNTDSSKATRHENSVKTESTFHHNLDELRNTYLKDHENFTTDEKLIVYDVFEFLKNTTRR